MIPNDLASEDAVDAVAAARRFERNRAGCGPPGLLAEEFDVAQRQLRGNLPQAFVHRLLLQCAAGQYESGAARASAQRVYALGSAGCRSGRTARS